MDKQRIKEIDIMRGIAIILVILGHAIIVYPIDLHEIPWCNALFTWLSSVHMPLFFLLAGFCYSLRKNIGETWAGCYGRYLVKKVKRIVIPYVIFGVFDMVSKFVFSDLVNHQRGIAESLKNLILFGGYWFLYTLFIIFLIFPLLERAIGERKNIWILTIVILLLLRILIVAPDILELDSVVMYFPYFMVGYMIKRGGAINKYKNFILGYRYVFVIGCSVAWGVCIWLVLNVVDLDIIYVLASIVGIIDTWIFAASVAQKRNRFLCDCSIYSLQLYLLNGYLLVISRTAIVLILGVESAVVIIIFNMFVTLLISLVLIKFVLAKIKPVKFLIGIV